MVKITDAQAKHLAALQQSRATLDSNTAALDAYVKAQREQLKQPVREAVAAALDAGIPARQVALKGLGYADVGSLKQYLDTGNNGRMLAPQPFAFAPSADSAPEPRDFVLSDHDSSFEELVYVPNGEEKPEVHIYYQSPVGRFESAHNRREKWGITEAEANDIDAAAVVELAKFYDREFTAEGRRDQ